MPSFGPRMVCTVCGAIGADSRPDSTLTSRSDPQLFRPSDSDNHGALTICLHAGGKLASVNAGFGLRGGGCSVDSLNQKSSS